MSGCPDTQLKKVELALGPMRFDTDTDRSVQGSLRVAKQDMEAWLYRVPNVIDLDPLKVSCQINERPATVYGKCVCPGKDDAGSGGADLSGGGAIDIWSNPRSAFLRKPKPARLRG